MSEVKNDRSNVNGNIHITKMGGEQEIFDVEKLRTSLLRAKASPRITEEIAEIIQGEIFEGISTDKIYARAYELLEKRERTTAARYSLRRALADLGPTGFPFEYFVGELFRAKGYEVKTGSVVMGKCIDHEVDMVAENETERIFMEIKFHNNMKIKSDMKVALYVKARFDDILAGAPNDGKESRGWLLTNTKFTKNALRYAECSGLKLVSWSYPEGESLQSMIEETGLHPLTCLTTLPKREKTLMMNDGLVLCRDVEINTEILEKYGLSEEKMHKVKAEAADVCIPFSSVDK